MSVKVETQPLACCSNERNCPNRFLNDAQRRDAAIVVQWECDWCDW